MASNITVDWKKTSFGGMLCDGTGDIAFTSSNGEAIQDMILTRSQGDKNAYKLYQICADLNSLVGATDPDEAEAAIQKQLTQVLSNQFLDRSDFTVETIQVGTVISIYIYVNGSLVTTSYVTVN